MNTTQDDVARATHLRVLAANWAEQLRSMGPRPRLRAGSSREAYRERMRPWRDLQAAIVGALDVAQALDGEAQRRAAGVVAAGSGDLAGKAVVLRELGMTFGAIAGTLGVPIGSAKTWARRARLGGAA